MVPTIDKCQLCICTTFSIIINTITLLQKLVFITTQYFPEALGINCDNLLSIEVVEYIQNQQNIQAANVDSITNIEPTTQPANSITNDSNDTK